ncbi:uncharacterized protein LOC121414123 isoform X2 [Lytechinus variegatus]|uniref:uncharacterized protein LOC121414123 isoform X2 n=1 Tax=Lytechinus variegatus TaxID=7654 RepID=UPI001BB1C865|nr:uncharacterized protein LOC121414123 isoform X2 [Lytechinus variegatus]
MMEYKDLGFVLVLFLSICHGGGLPGVTGQWTNFARGNFFQDKFCEIFCPKDDTRPRLTLTDEQIETILNSEEIIKMLEENPELLHGDEELEGACVIQFNRDQRDSILAQYGGFFSTRKEANELEETATRVNVPSKPLLDPADQEKLDDFLENNPGRTADEDAGTSGEQQEKTHDSILSYYRGSSSSGSGSYEWSNSGSSGSSGSDSRRRRKRRGANTVGDSHKTLKDQPRDVKLLSDISVKNSIRKRSLRSRTRSNGAARVKRGPTSAPLCESIIDAKAIDIALTSDNKLVQLPQFSEIGLNQWFLTETCKYPYSLVHEDVGCYSTTRGHKALAVDLSVDPTENNSTIFEGIIMVESCKAFISGAEEVNVQEGTSSNSSSTNSTTT